MSDNFKPHPFVIALKALQPVFANGFYLRSARDAEEKPLQYPLIDYFIESGGVKTYDPSTNIWRASFDVRLDVMVQETKPLDWCKFDFLKDAQDRGALHHYFENPAVDLRAWYSQMGQKNQECLLPCHWPHHYHVYTDPGFSSVHVFRICPQIHWERQ